MFPLSQTLSHSAPHSSDSYRNSALTLLLWAHLESNQAPTDYESVALTE
jgi:hypothetical protein